METFPLAGLPIFSLSSAPSIPWSSAFLAKCMMIGGKFSKMVLSIVISEFGISKSMFLPIFKASWKMERLIGCKIMSKGNILSEMICF